MGSNESHFNVLLIVRDKVTSQGPQTITVLKRKESQNGIELRPFCSPAKCLTASHCLLGNYNYLGWNTIPRVLGLEMYVCVVSVTRVRLREWHFISIMSLLLFFKLYWLPVIPP